MLGGKRCSFRIKGRGKKTNKVVEVPSGKKEYKKKSVWVTSTAMMKPLPQLGPMIEFKKKELKARVPESV